MINSGKWIAAIFLALAAGAAQAQTNWAGWYLGGSANYEWGSSDVGTQVNFSPTGYFATTSTTSISSVGSGTLKPSNGFVGIHGGYNWQAANWVYGIEGDIGNMRANASRTTGSVYPCCAPTSYTLTQSISTNYEASLRARIGYATNNWLFYGTGGASFTTMTFRQTFSDTFAAASETGSTQKSAIGWTLGGGVEYALPGRWTIRGEYQHMDFGRMSGNGGTLTAFTPAIAFPTNVFTNSANLKVDAVRVGFTYRF